MQRRKRQAGTPRQRIAAVSLGVLVSAACSFSTDGITFVPDEEFDGMAGGANHSGSGGKGSAGANSGGTSHSGSGGTDEAGTDSGGTSGDAGSDSGSGGEAGEVTSDGGTAGLGAGGKGGSLNTAGLGAAGQGGSLNTAGAGGKGGSLNTGGAGAGGKGGSLNTGGAGASGIAGTLNTAGAPSVPTGGSGGSGGAPSGRTYPCTGETPGDKLIADFKGIAQLGQEWKGGQAGNTRFSVYGFPDPANGKPNVKLGSDNLTVEALNVLAPVGAGIRISPCINFKEAQTILFTISGSGDPRSGVIPTIALRIYTNQNLAANDTTREGMCVPPVGQDPILFCQPAHVDFELPTSTKQLEFKFVDFKGGKPSDTLQLDQVKMIEWAFTSTLPLKPYDATYTVDDVSLSY
ncbi:MAG: hypothetical protein WDO74_28055 [Pseudomonadota bacterium]